MEREDRNESMAEGTAEAAGHRSKVSMDALNFLGYILTGEAAQAIGRWTQAVVLGMFSPCKAVTLA